MAGATAIDTSTPRSSRAAGQSMQRDPRAYLADVLDAAGSPGRHRGPRPRGDGRTCCCARPSSGSPRSRARRRQAPAREDPVRAGACRSRSHRGLAHRPRHGYDIAEHEAASAADQIEVPGRSPPSQPCSPNSMLPWPGDHAALTPWGMGHRGRCVQRLIRLIGAPTRAPIGRFPPASRPGTPLDSLPCSWRLGPPTSASGPGPDGLIMRQATRAGAMRVAPGLAQPRFPAAFAVPGTHDHDEPEAA